MIKKRTVALTLVFGMAVVVVVLEAKCSKSLSLKNVKSNKKQSIVINYITLIK